MGNYIYQDMDHAARVRLLTKTGRKETMSFTRSLSEAELIEEKDKYAREAMRRSQLKDELKAYTDDAKGQISALEDQMTERLTVIANEKRQVHDEVFAIADHAAHKMLYYDKLGELVHSRSMKPEEIQGRLFLDGGQAAPEAQGPQIQDDEIQDAIIVEEHDGPNPEGTTATEVEPRETFYKDPQQEANEKFGEKKKPAKKAAKKNPDAAFKGAKKAHPLGKKKLDPADEPFEDETL